MLDCHSTSPEVKAGKPGVAVLPVGAIEQHGTHLPLGTDLMIAQAFAEELAKKLDAYLLPPIAISCSIEHREAPGTVYLRAETLSLVIRDIAHACRDWGSRRLILTNAHGGNWILKPTIRQLNRDLAPFRVILLDVDMAPAARAEIFERPAGDVHGGEYETSLMLHLYPKDVRPLPPPSDKPFPRQAFLDYVDITRLTPLGHWGWPEKATAEKGKRAADAIMDHLLRLLEEIDRL